MSKAAASIDAATAEPSLPIHSTALETDRQFVTALSRGLEVLRCFSAARPELGAKEIASMIGLPQPTVWRLCYTLTKLGYLVAGSASGKLRVGAPTLALGAASLDALQYRDIIRPHLKRFISRYPAAVILAQQHQMTMIYVLRCDGNTTFVMNLPTGSSISLTNSVVGHVCLAGMPAPRADAIIAQSATQAPKRVDSLAQKVDRARQEMMEKGFVTRIGQGRDGVSLVAIPLMAADGSSAYTLLSGGPAFALPQTLLEDDIGPELIKLAKQVQPALSGLKK